MQHREANRPVRLAQDAEYQAARSEMHKRAREETTLMRFVIDPHEAAEWSTLYSKTVTDNGTAGPNRSLDPKARRFLWRSRRGLRATTVKPGTGIETWTLRDRISNEIHLLRLAGTWTPTGLSLISFIDKCDAKPSWVFHSGKSVFEIVGRVWQLDLEPHHSF